MSQAGPSIDGVKSRLSDLAARLDAFSTWLENTDDRVAELEDENAELRKRLESVEARLEAVEDTSPGKEGKVRAIVQQARNLREGDQQGVVMDPEQIVGATGVSKRYAYDLADEDGLPSEYHWILTREQARQEQYGSLEIDGSTAGKAIVVDFERLHSDQEALNKFNNDSGGEGV